MKNSFTEALHKSSSAVRIEEKSVRKKERGGGFGWVVRAEVNMEYAQTANALNNRTWRKAHTCCEWNVPRGSFRSRRRPFTTTLPVLSILSLSRWCFNHNYYFCSIEQLMDNCAFKCWSYSDRKKREWILQNKILFCMKEMQPIFGPIRVSALTFSWQF